jgi:hypothetical protein
MHMNKDCENYTVHNWAYTKLRKSVFRMSLFPPKHKIWAVLFEEEVVSKMEASHPWHYSRVFFSFRFLLQGSFFSCVDFLNAHTFNLIEKPVRTCKYHLFCVCFSASLCANSFILIFTPFANSLARMLMNVLTVKKTKPWYVLVFPILLPFGHFFFNVYWMVL